MLEHELLLSCAKTKPDSARISEILQNRLDWDYIVLQSYLHNLGSLLYNSLKDFPVPVHKTLETIYARTGLHNMLYLDELKRIGEELGKRRIRFITLKGPSLAKDVYGNIALRPFVDIDILVRKSELHKIRSVLRALGYSCNHPQFYEMYHFHLPCTKRGKIGFLVELHWAFVDRFILNRVDMESVWKNTSSNTLSPETNMLYLLLHIEKHAFLNKVIYEEQNPGDWIFTNPRGNQLMWYTDLYELIHNGRTDLDKVRDLAEEWAVSDILYHNLYLSNKLYPLHEVGKVLSGMSHHRISPLKKVFYMPALRQRDYAMVYGGKEFEPASQETAGLRLGDEKNRHAFGFSRAMHLRPIRILGLIDYLFPSSRKIAAHYRVSGKAPVMLYYIVHIAGGLIQIFGELFGICCHLLFSSCMSLVKKAKPDQIFTF